MHWPRLPPTRSAPRVRTSRPHVDLAHPGVGRVVWQARLLGNHRAERKGGRHETAREGMAADEGAGPRWAKGADDLPMTAVVDLDVHEACGVPRPQQGPAISQGLSVAQP